LVNSPSRRTRLVIAEDHPSVARALKRLLANRFEIVAEVTDGNAAVDAARLRPDVMILDVSLPKMNGLEACRQIRQQEPMIRLVVVSAAVFPELKEESVRLRHICRRAEGRYASRPDRRHRGSPLSCRRRGLGRAESLDVIWSR
jgi:CheY-like chemotaxis protein